MSTPNVFDLNGHGVRCQSDLALLLDEANARVAEARSIDIQDTRALRDAALVARAAFARFWAKVARATFDWSRGNLAEDRLAANVGVQLAVHHLFLQRGITEMSPLLELEDFLSRIDVSTPAPPRQRRARRPSNVIDLTTARRARARKAAHS